MLQVDLPLIWIATEPLLTLFSRELKPIEPEPRYVKSDVTIGNRYR